MASFAAELPIRTARLVLRPLEPADAPAVTRLVNDYSVAGNLSRVPFPYRDGLALEWIAATRGQIETGTGCHLAITQGGVLVGCVGLTLRQGGQGQGGQGHNGPAELGYWVGRKFWRQGIAREAASALCEWGERVLGLAEYEASALTDNEGSHAVLRAIGFEPAGQGAEPFLSRNRNMPVVLFRRRAAAAAKNPAAPPPAASAAKDFAPPPAASAAKDFAPPPAASAAKDFAPPAAKPILLVVACALVDVEGRVLLAQRPEGKSMAGLWEFPGGKLAEGETPEAALIRELREELGIETREACLSPLFFASHAYEKFHLLMPLYICRKWEGRVSPREGQQLAWVRPQKLADYPMPPADIPLVALLRDFL
ncbi:bifunctional GNAT family N-acetyltransferase/(deoxy)nucleoside triphosphate pyrophosphohydrolase [Roseococcus suduntuyensis]|uniref:bifunctional GNAT family N-acetyltransferase/(deoxy)nucleoside triphosphate pyrophosphohydrolase n=2 Tax=Roseococcus suduntuyensis TaxID=455361 RepID=UPI001A8E867C|nr:bifunctional GNAT family N-acetyltransferase/(deoxy)nucleoside triphosphate pyrophosphohydrolase [Roseococcus suduntuyensis]